ncbi:hypothetical protein ACTFIY_003676 [Dictyostelium cf. discoideum]
MDKENQIIKSVWGNKYIRDLIFFYLNLYNNNSKKYNFTIKELNGYVYKNYLLDVSLKGGGSNLDAGDLPSSIRYLKFVDIYNPILQENSLPDSLVSVTFNKRFNQQLNNKIIKNEIKIIEFTGIFNQSLGGWLPKGLEVLKLNESFQQPILPNQLPEGLIFLYLDNAYQIPASTTNLIVRTNVEINVGMIPHNVTNIEFYDSFNNSIEPLALPSSIRSISFDDAFNRELVGNILLSNIEHIKLGKLFRSRIDIPSAVKTLKLTGDNHPYGFFFSNSGFNECYSLTNLELVTNLNLGYCYNFPIKENSLPENLKSLNFGKSFNRPININLLKTLKIIYFQCPTFNQNINELPNQLPLLETIYLSTNNISFINTLDPSFYSKFIRVTDE